MGVLNKKRYKSMGNSQSMIKINFEDIQYCCKNPETCLLINTLPSI